MIKGQTKWIDKLSNGLILETGFDGMHWGQVIEIRPHNSRRLLSGITAHTRQEINKWISDYLQYWNIEIAD